MIRPFYPTISLRLSRPSEHKDELMRNRVRDNKWSESGFTLVELLLTMAIIVILGSVAVVSAVIMIRNIRQAASDKTAESLYTAVTAHLQEVWAFDYEKVETLKLADEAYGVSADPLVIRYVAKDVGDSLGADAERLKIVLGEDGSAVGADYYGDSIIVEYNPSSLQVYSVFYSSEVSPSDYYTSSGSAENSLDDLRSDVSKRRSEFKGYLGYYHADTQNLPELSENEYGVTVGLSSAYVGDPIRHLRNLDELTAPVSVHIPSEEYGNIDKLKFEISISGLESGAVAKITYDEQDALNGGILKYYAANMLRTSNKYADSKMTSFEIVIDNLKDANFKKLFCDTTPGPKTATIRFLGMTTGATPTPVVMEKNVPATLVPNISGKLFTPGEDIEVKVSTISADGVEMNITDDSENSAKDNTLYAYGSRKITDSTDYYAAYLSYPRHLQNLNSDISGMGTGLYTDLAIRAYQTDILDFTKEGDKLWRTLYSDKTKKNPYDSIMPFTPIVNADIEGLYGDYKLSYNGTTSSMDATSLRSAGYVGETEHSIKGLVIRSTVTKTVNNAGIFAGFSGGEIKNITVISPRISGKDVTGGLIAKAALRRGKSLNIENCSLYMTDEYCGPYFENDAPYGIVEKAGSNDPYIQDDSDATGIWMSGKNHAGGLIGIFAHDTTDPSASGDMPSLTIKNSHASTVIDTTDSSGTSGGLIGYVGSDASSQSVSVLIEKSYADSYIYGADSGGLIGRIAPSNTVDLKNVYTAGFEEGAFQAGFANGTISSAIASYAFTHMSTANNSRVFTTAAKINSTDGKVYYFPQVNVNSGNVGRITDADNTTSVEDIPATGPSKTIGELLLSVLGSAFEADYGDTSPYNLRDGMALSSYTKPKLKNMIHYGDWQDEFTAGALCYYEKYSKAGSKIRFYGGNYNALYNNLEDGAAVAADGYGLVFKKNASAVDMPDSVTLKYEFAGAAPYTETIDLTTASYLEADYDNHEYIIYKFNNTYVNYRLNVESPFYTKVEVTYEKNGTEAGTEVYYFNPHFARAVGYLGPKDDSTTLTVPELRPNGIIYVRSARHLYNLSLYYKYYRTATQGRIFRQTYDISYKDYDWHGYFDEHIPAGSIIVRQNPIGLKPAESFKATYNGGCYKIRDISFVLERGKTSGTYYTGLFGYNEGDLRNIVLFSDYDNYDTNAVSVTVYSEVGRNHYYADKNAKIYHYAGSDEDISKNSELYLGILSGCNTGTITNCSVAGYCMADSRGTIVGNSNGYIYAGGLVGENNGTVTNSSADTPQIRLTTNYTTAYIGGFAGKNTGKITDSYSLGHIEVVNPRGGSITLAGFTPRNSGEIASSYAAENISASGNSTVYAFSSQGGSVRNCDYLGTGTFSYAGHLYTYKYPGDTGTGISRTRDELVNDAKKNSEVATGNSVDYTAYKDGTDYPFKAVVKDINGQYIHYGDWQRNPGMGEYGIFYWEKEEGHANSGYHFSFVGVGKADDIAGTTLCNAHDDGGVIVDYGYGYYVKKGNETNVSSSATGLHLPGSILSDVADELKKEVSDYTFYPYRTLKANDTNLSDYLYLDYSASEVIGADNNTDICNGEWKLTKDGTEKIFYVAPFFANAMSLKNGYNTTFIVESQDGINQTDYEKKPGTTENPYEIRTVEQLQYINWNANTKNVSSIATSDPDIYKAFPYLAYASVTGMGKQKKADAGHNLTLKFLQSHDVSGIDKNGNAVIPNYTPIAASQSANSVGAKYDAVLYAWFGSDYDGQSYKITNISISSPAFSVGVFGVTVSAGLNNIILYSDRDSVIERNNGTDMAIGGYNIGGLVGIAYKYADASGLVYNCAVAGYKIKDMSTNQQTVGGGNVGGLIGATTVDVKNCSAVTDIEIGCTHAHDTTLYQNGHSEFGDYVRTGGLVGALPGAATNCYSGGSIRVGDATLAESRRNNGTLIAQDEEDGAVCERKNSTNVYIGGIAGSAYTMNYQNFTGRNNNPNDGSPTMTNCYTYVDFPELRGSIRSITMIASLADRYSTTVSNNYRVNITNCHYLNTYDRSKTDNAAKYTIKSDAGAVATVSAYDALHQMTNFSYTTDGDSGETYYENMIRGGGTYVSLITGYNNGRIAQKHYDMDVRPSPESHDQLSGKGTVSVYEKSGTSGVPGSYITYNNILEALNAGGTGTFDWVTVTQPNGANIDGKYSFPGNNRVLDGLNYPFPTIVKQKDLVFNRDVNVHYGRWPISGMYWSEARSEMDIFGDQSTDGFAYKELQMLETGDITLTPTSFDMEVGDIVQIDSVTKTSAGTYTIRFKALKTGTETITVAGSAKLILEVKANFLVSTDPPTITVSNGAEKTLNLKTSAVSTPDPATGASTVTDLSAKTEWTVTVRDNGSAYVGFLDSVPGLYDKTYALGTTSCNITGSEPGRTQIVVKAVLPYNGVNYESSVYLQLQTYGVIGLSNHGLGSAFGATGFRNETSRATDGTNNGSDSADFGADAPVMSDEGWTDLYIYESYADETLAGMRITEISIGGDTNSNITDDGSSPIYTIGGYVIDIGSTSANMSADAKYRYRSIKIRPTTGSNGGDVNISITLKDGETNAYYVLTGNMTVTHMVKAESNEDPNASEKAVLPWKALHADTSGNVNLYNAGIPTLTGWIFTGWNTAADGSGTPYCTGADNTTDQTIVITDDITLYARWTRASYTVAFSAASGSEKNPGDNLANKTANYDEDVTLYDTTEVNGKYDPPTDGGGFVGWNEIADGSGIAYKPGAVVRNLTNTNGATVTLYAQWRDYNRITFADYKDGTGDPAKRQVDIPAGNITYQTKAADMQDDTLSWAQRGGAWGYFRTSTAGTTYKLVGWDANRRADAAAVTYKIKDKITDDGSVIPVFPEIQGIYTDCTFYAIWEEMGYSITLKDTLAGTADVTYSDLSGSLKSLNNITGYTTPTCTGFRFVGWYTDRIANGGEKYAGSDGLLKEGKNLADLLAGSYSVTLYARYSEDIYVAAASPKDGFDYLVTITERGNSVKPYQGRFAYLLRNNTTDFKPGSGNLDLAGKDHTFRDANEHQKFYTGEAGGSANSLGSAVYMDNNSMPTDVYNNNRSTAIPIDMDIPVDAVWTWHGTATEGTFEMTNSAGNYLYTETGSPPHLRIGATQGIWNIVPKTGYSLLKSTEATNYYVHCDYWNLNLSSNNATNEGGNPPNNRSFRVTFYEKTTVYLDEHP